MKKIFLFCITAIFVSLQISAQITTDTLYLKNGSIITGKLRVKSKTQYEILTSDGLLFNFTSQEVEKFTKEVPRKKTDNQILTVAKDGKKKKVTFSFKPDKNLGSKQLMALFCIQKIILSRKML
jgi:hypothetical protein